MKTEQLYRPAKNTPLALALLTLGLSVILCMSLFFSSEIPPSPDGGIFHGWALLGTFAGFFAIATGGFLLGRDGGYQRGYADGSWDIGCKNVNMITTLSEEQKKHYELGRKLGYEEAKADDLSH